MRDDSSRLWWDEITGPALLLREVADNLQNVRSVLLLVPDDLPWRKQMRSSVECLLHENDRDLFIDYIDCKTECLTDTEGNIEVAGFLLDRYAYPEVKSGYRKSSRISIQQYMLDKRVLENRIVWVKGMNGQQILSWLNFCKVYRSKSRYDGLFVIESYEETLPHVSVPNMKTLPYSEYVTYYDALLFNNQIVSSTHNPLEWMQYMATVSSLLCRCDVELSETLIKRGDFSIASPTDMLLQIAEDPCFENRYAAERLDAEHPFALIRAEKNGEMQHMIWKAQLQILFPLLEAERIGFIERHDEEIREALSAEYVDPNENAKHYIRQLGKRVADPYDVEIGTVHRMSHLRRASDSSLYLLFLPSGSDRARVNLLCGMRNSIAHVEPCSVGSIAEFLSQYPYKW